LVMAFMTYDLISHLCFQKYNSKMASSITVPTAEPPKESNEMFETFSLISASLGLGKYIKPVANILKAILALLYLVAAFPWAIVAAFFVETSKNPGCYSWSEVGWRCTAGFGIWINGALMFIFIPLEQSDGTRSPYLYLILGYCVGVGILITMQALIGRWFEEKQTGLGKEMAQEYWRKIVMIFGVNTTGVKTSATSWSWAMSLFAIIMGFLFFTIATSNLAEWKTATGRCSGDNLCSEDRSCSIPDQVPADIEGKCHCCEVRVANPGLFDLFTQIGGTVAFYYGIAKVLALFFVWAEDKIEATKREAESVLDKSETNVCEGKDAESKEHSI